MTGHAALVRYNTRDAESMMAYLRAMHAPSYKLYVTRKIPAAMMKQAEQLVRGEYQRRLLRGQSPWEDIGNKSIGGGYTKSRDGFRKRLAEIGLFPIITARSGRKGGTRVLMARVPTPLVEQLASVGVPVEDDDAPEVIIIDDMTPEERAAHGFTP